MRPLNFMTPLKFLFLLTAALYIGNGFAAMGFSVLLLLHALTLVQGFIFGLLFADWKVRRAFRRSLRKWDQ